MKKMTWIIISIIVIAVAIGGYAIVKVNDVKEPGFTILVKAGSAEIRQYQPFIVAEVEVKGEARTAASEGFRLVADYIFGNNTAKTSGISEKIAMTAPVIQQGKSEKIAMTAPVLIEPNNAVVGAYPTEGTWSLRFVMPAEYSYESLPTPNNKAVKIIAVAAKKYAVVRFSGFWTDANVEKHWQELQSFVKAKGLTTLGAPQTAFYNAPITPPFLRRNEVMIEVK